MKASTLGLWAVFAFAQGFLGAAGGPSHAEELTSVLLFQDDFEDGVLDDWVFYDEDGNFTYGADSPWGIVVDGGSGYLRGISHAFALPNIDGFADGKVTLDFKTASDGQFHVNVRETTNKEHGRYFINVQPSAVVLNKQVGDTFSTLSIAETHMDAGRWHTMQVVLQGSSLKILMDGSSVLAHTDTSEPLLSGRFSLESLLESPTCIDNVRIEGNRLKQTKRWKKMGGPTGGLGYDVRFKPDDPSVMYVTDNPSGVNKSYDGGRTWVQRNDGILTRSGYSGDDIPIFCLTIDPSDSSIIWAGTQFNRGIYKSTDGGETWEKKDNGISEWQEITFRGFGVDVNHPNVVFAGAEITTGLRGYEFDKARGKIYRTKDGGENWACVWEGDSLVRFVIVDPMDSDIVYASTGIFDREAYNNIGLGVLKSEDGGISWKQMNNGLTNLFVGYLEMDSVDPRILFAATGMNQQEKYGYTQGGIFKTQDGGHTWRHVLPFPHVLNAVAVSPQNHLIVYAAGDGCFFRSEDGGETWTNLGNWGPPGIWPGQPIGLAVSPTNPYLVFANNYNGGNFKSEDGGVTWVNSSHGYTGANLRMVRVDKSDRNRVFCVGRSGTFRTLDAGKTWAGLNYDPLIGNDEVSIAIHPSNPDRILVGNEGDGAIYASSNGGLSWSLLYQYPAAYDSGNWHSFKSIRYSPSNPDIVYAGMRRVQNIGMIDPDDGPSYGMLKSTNGGASWFEINSGLEPTYRKSINDICVAPSDPALAYIATFKNGVWKTTDGGAHWECKSANTPELSDARSLAMHPYNTDTLFVGTRDNGVWMTADGGDSWQSASLGMPANAAVLSVLLDPVDPGRLYAADLLTGVYISIDGGKYWYPINDGLSFRAVSNMDVSSDGAVLYAATAGGGVYAFSESMAEMLAVDAGGEGLLVFDRLDWASVSPADPEKITTWGGKLVADFSEYGLYAYDGKQWTFLHWVHPEDMIAWGESLVLNFGMYGVYAYDGAGWACIHWYSPEGMTAWGNWLVLDYGLYGIYAFDGVYWTWVHGADPDGMIAWGDMLVVDFGAYGVYGFDGMDWVLITPDSPEGMTVWDERLVLDFGASGVYSYTVGGSDPTRLYDGDPEQMIGWKDLLVLDMGSDGLHVFDGTSVERIRETNAEHLTIVEFH